MGWLSFLEICLNKLGNVITLDGKLAVNKDREGLVRTYFTEILFNLKQNSSFMLLPQKKRMIRCVIDDI